MWRQRLPVGSSNVRVQPARPAQRRRRGNMADKTSTRLQHPEFRGHIGFARAEITPPIGIYSRTWGSARHDQAEGIHRPLLATCLRFQDADGGEELILITLDVMI